jgi:hypothetical protein
MQGKHMSVKECTSLSIKRISYLITGYLSSQLSTSEFKELEDWLFQSIQNQLLFAEMLLPYNIKYASQQQ